LFAQLVSKIFNLCGHDPPTSQTDGQTDDERQQDRALHCSSASRGKTSTAVVNYCICNKLHTRGFASTKYHFHNMYILWTNAINSL